MAQLYPNLCNPMDCSMPGFPVLHYLSELYQTNVHWVGDAMQTSHPLSSHSIFPSIRVFSNELGLHIRWPKHWRLSISPFYEYSGLTSFRINWFDLLAVQVTLMSFLQDHCSKASIRWCSPFFIVQLSQPYMTTGKKNKQTKNIALTTWTYVGKLMSRLFNMVSRFLIAFLPRSKHLLISWLQSQWFWSPRK